MNDNTRDSGRPHSLYAEGFDTARELGIGALIPIAMSGKSPMVPGFTGYGGKWPSDADYTKWLRLRRANIGIRLHPEFAGIDVDAHSGKAGRQSLRDLEKDLGRLPVTLMSTSRDGISGVRVFALPRRFWNVTWKGIAAPGIDIVSWHNRHVMAPPSIHPRGVPYRWERSPGRKVRTRGGVPPVLAELPGRWCEFLVSGSPAARRAERAQPDGGPAAFLTRHGGGQMCGLVAESAARWLGEVTAAGREGGAHDAALRAIRHIVLLIADGHVGANSALWPVRSAFIDAVSPRRGERKAVDEYRRMARGAITEAEARIRKRGIPPDPCSELDELLANFKPIRAGGSQCGNVGSDHKKGNR
jgi:hypothetical protein